jgi:hypothetical protein
MSWHLRFVTQHREGDILSAELASDICNAAGQIVLDSH